MALRLRHSGFSLTELLVAMAIVITLMGGLMVLFSGAVTTVRQGYQSMGGTELGRAAVTRLERDLQQAFTARDQGQAYQFYGRPDGFMFVGQLSDGKLGRVTYAIHPGASPLEFPTVLVESLRQTLNRIYSQAYRYAREMGMPDDQARADAQGAVGAFADAYGVNLAGVNWDSAAPFDSMIVILENPERTIELQVMVSTWALVRYEEPGKTDLDTFPLPSGFEWPYIDPSNPGRDIYPPAGEGFDLSELLLSALGPSPASDIREIIQNVQARQDRQIYQVRPETVKEIVAAKRREIWIRMLSSYLPPLSERFWQEVVNAPVGDYVLSERILASAKLLHPAGGFILLSTAPQKPIDALDIPGIFAYGDGKGQFQRYFNDIANIDGYAAYLNNPGEQALENFDLILSRTLGGAALSEAGFGSPLSPRIPRVVNVGFWIMMERAQPGSGDFRQWFNMLVEVPSAATRAMPASLTPNPGRA